MFRSLTQGRKVHTPTSYHRTGTTEGIPADNESNINTNTGSDNPNRK